MTSALLESDKRSVSPCCATANVIRIDYVYAVMEKAADSTVWRPAFRLCNT